MAAVRSGCLVVGAAGRPCFFIEHPSYLTEGPRAEQWLPTQRYLAGIVLKINKVSLSLPRKQLTVFVASDKISVFT